MKFKVKKAWNLFGKAGLTALAVGVAFSMFAIPASAQGKGTVKVESGKIRKSPDTGSEVLGSVSSSSKKTIDIISSTTASDGYTWYKVFVDGSTTGYIRADLVKDVEGEIPSEKYEAKKEEGQTEEKKEDSKTEEKKEDSKTEEKKEDSKKETVGEQKGETQFVQITDSEATAGTVRGSKVNVRENPSTSAKKVGTAEGGKEVAILGEAQDNSKAVWYQVQFDSVTGFIRNDFIEVTATVNDAEEEPQEEEPAEEEEVEETQVNNDFEVKYELNGEGVEEWYLYDNVKGVKQSLEKLLAFTAQAQQGETEAVSKLGTYKVVLIILVALVVALVVAVTVLIFKLRDSYEYEYDDDDDDDDEDDDDEEDDDEEEEEVEEEPAVRRRGRSSRQTVTETSRRTHHRYEDEKSPKSGDSWESRNFLDVDDDMEFEFLDLK